MAQGMENTVSNGQGSKPHSAIEKGELKISSDKDKDKAKDKFNDLILNSSMSGSIEKYI